MRKHKIQIVQIYNILNQMIYIFKINEKQTAEEILKFILKMKTKPWDIHTTYGDFLMNNQWFQEALHMYIKVHLNSAEIPVENELLNSSVFFNQINFICLSISIFSYQKTVQKYF